MARSNDVVMHKCCSLCRLVTIWVSSVALTRAERAEALAILFACMASAVACQAQSGSSVSMKAAGLGLLLIGLRVLLLTSTASVPPWLTDLLHPALEVR